MNSETASDITMRVAIGWEARKAGAWKMLDGQIVNDLTQALNAVTTNGMILLPLWPTEAMALIDLLRAQDEQAAGVR